MLTQADKFLISDALEYYKISEHLDITGTRSTERGFDHWYDWSPANVIWMHIIGRSLFIQIILSIITVYILYQINPYLGWIWALYPVAAAYSVSYNKENLLFFFTCLLLSCKNKRYLLILFIIMIPFTGLRVANPDNMPSNGFMWNFWAYIKPDFNILDRIGNWPNYILIVPYTCLIIWYIRFAKPSWTLFTIIVYSLIFAFTYGSSRYREPMMMIIFYEFAEYISKPNIMPFLHKLRKIRRFVFYKELAGEVKIFDFVDIKQEFRGDAEEGEWTDIYFID